ncbi:hypothetical protein GCM10027289_15790 [Tsukamurella serpentis]
MTAFTQVTTSVTSVAAVTACGLILAGCGSPSTSSTDAGPPPSGTLAAPSSASVSAPAEARGPSCGQTRGPDGALYVHALGTAQVDCAAAMRIADEFSPKIATGQPATVSGWTCTFPKAPDMLARCADGDKAIGFFTSQ